MAGGNGGSSGSGGTEGKLSFDEFGAADGFVDVGGVAGFELAGAVVENGAGVAAEPAVGQEGAVLSAASDAPLTDNGGTPSGGWFQALLAPAFGCAGPSLIFK